MDHLVASRLVAASLLAALATACRAGPRDTPAAAQREVASILDRRRDEVAEVRGGLDLIEAERRAADQRHSPPHAIGITDALRLAARGSTAYLEARERVWLAALAVTDERALWRTRYGVAASGELVRADDGTTVGGRGDATIAQSLEAGGAFLLSIATDVLRDLTGSPLRTARSILNTEIVLPLARGSSSLVALEPLRQARNELLYALREFALFQQGFTLDVATRFYRTIELRDIWRNETRTYESLQSLVAEQAEEAEAGRLPPFQVDQARQELLQADDRRVRALAAYESALDRLLIDLGLPIRAGIEIDDAALRSLQNEDPLPPPFDVATALRTATERRLDLATARDRETDAMRHVAVAMDALKMGLDLRLGAGASTPGTKPFDLDDATFDGVVGIDLDLPLERTAERNTVVRRMIDARRARRHRERLADAIDAEVREAWRDLAEAARSIPIQREGLRLAERRVESTQMLLEGGTATIRDRLEAENARVSSANALTRVLVDHVLVRLEVERAAGILAVDADGDWSWTRPNVAPAAPAGGGDDASAPNPNASAVVLPEAAADEVLGSPPAGTVEPDR